jgi:branched-subunit amino acid transport protein
MNSGDVVLALVGLGGVTLATRAFFLLPEREWPLPAWARRAMKYAPLAALVAIIAPELAYANGVPLTTLADARLWAALVGVAYFAWRRGMLGTIFAGTAVYLPLKLGLGW